jgi:hypothetical protein
MNFAIVGQVCELLHFRDRWWLNLICGGGRWLRTSLVSDLKHFRDKRKMLLTPEVDARFTASRSQSTRNEP